MKGIKLSIFILIFLNPIYVFCQRGDFNWILGDSVGITFNTPNLEPQPLLGLKFPIGMRVEEPRGSAVISDCNGNFLFYGAVDESIELINREVGFQIRGAYVILDKSFAKIPELDTIFRAGLTQNSYLIPYPGSNKLFLYLIPSIWRAKPYDWFGMSIYVIDRTKRNGLGGIINRIERKDRYLVDLFRHSNGRDWWIVTGDTVNFYDWMNSKFISYLFTDKGITDSSIFYIDQTPFSSLSKRPNFFMFVYHAYGSYCCYKDPSTNFRFCVSSAGFPSDTNNRHLLIFKFDSEEGKLAYKGMFKICDSCWVIHGKPLFLPKSNKIYIGTRDLYQVPGKDSIFQWKHKLFQFTFLSEPELTEQTRKQVGPTKEFTFIHSPFGQSPYPWPPIDYFNDLKLAPNGKVYVLHYGGNFLSEISNPDSDAENIIFKDTAIFFGPYSLFWFPNTVSGSSCLGQIDVWLPDTVVKIGTKNLCIPIYAQKVGEIIEGIEFETSIRFDAKAFLPVNVDSKIENGDRIVKITGRSEVISDEPKVIGWLCGDVFLGSKSQIPLKFESFQWKDSYLETETHDGSLTIVGVCEPELLQIELLNPINIIVHPNPVYSNEVEIVVEGLKGMNYLLEIYNSRGMVVEREGIYMEDSVAVIRKSLTSYPNGLYLFKVGTRSVVVIKI